MDACYRTGSRLYGDDLEGSALEQWYQEEELGYYQLTDGLDPHDQTGDNNFWKILNSKIYWDFVGNRKFDTALAFGTANGDDVAPFSSQVERFIGVEPQEKWWSNSIAGRPSTFVKPGVDSSIPVETGSIDIVLCFGVLHHVARVGRSLAEFKRILRPGGMALIREPISSMGDWSRPRPGSTKNERGIDPTWMVSTARAAGLHLERYRPAAFGPLIALHNRAGHLQPGPIATGADLFLSKLFSWNHRYYRERWWHRIAPGAAYYLFRNPVSTSRR
jgi:SAM-dependent methyltransferase